MKDIKKHYQDLIKDINLNNDKVVSGLKNYITWLEDKMFKLQEELEKKDEHADLQNEIDEYNRLEAQKNMNLEDEICEIKAENIKLEAENSRLQKAYSDLEKAYKLTIEPASYRLGDATVVHHCGEGKPKVYKPKTGRKAGSKSKTVVVYCKDCGTYFQAKSKLAKYCSSCRDKRAKQSRAKWLAKQKEQK